MGPYFRSRPNLGKKNLTPKPTRKWAGHKHSYFVGLDSGPRTPFRPGFREEKSAVCCETVPNQPDF